MQKLKKNSLYSKQRKEQGTMSFLKTIMGLVIWRKWNNRQGRNWKRKDAGKYPTLREILGSVIVEDVKCEQEAKVGTVIAMKKKLEV